MLGTVGSGQALTDRHRTMSWAARLKRVFTIDNRAPASTNDIRLDEIDFIYFKRAYSLTPDEGAARAYRLLAQIMEDYGRAGVATSVMRGKEYLVAPLADRRPRHPARGDAAFRGRAALAALDRPLRARSIGPYKD